MKQSTTNTWLRHLTLFAVVLLMGAFDTGSATAQDEKEITVKVDGDVVTVNGEVVSPDEEGRVILKSDDGEDVEVYIRRSDDDHLVWTRRRGDGPGRYTLRLDRDSIWTSDEDADGDLEREFRFRARPGSRIMGLFDGEEKALQEHLMTLRERIPAVRREARDVARTRFELQSDLAGIHEAPMLGMLFELGEEQQKMEQEIRELAREVRQAEGAERDELEQKLDQKLSEAFEAKQAATTRQLENMQKRLEELQSRRQERSAARQQIIERRKRQLLGERDVLDW